MSEYLRQVIVVDKSLSMPSGKLAAMVAHAAMTFLLKKFHDYYRIEDAGLVERTLFFTTAEDQWLTELDPGLEDAGQVSMAKIVCQVASNAELLQVERKARDAGLEVHLVVDSGHSHNKPGTLCCIAIGPDRPERLAPVTGGLKVYR